jgi:hypothetical protein
VIGPTLQDFALKPVLRLALKDASGEVLEEVPINRIAEVFSGMIGGGSYGPFVNPTAFLGFLAEGKQDTITNRDDYPFVGLKGPVRVKLALDVSDDALKRVKSVSLESAMWGVDTRNSR